MWLIVIQVWLAASLPVALVLGRAIAQRDEQVSAGA